MNLHQASDLTSAVIDVLEAAGLLVGDGIAPVGGGWSGAAGASTFVPYVVVYNLVGGRTDGPIDAPDEDAFPIYQLTSVGGAARQCEHTADTAREAVMAGGFTLTNRRVVHVTCEMLGGAVRDDDAQPPVWFSPDRYRFITTPDETVTGS